MMRAAGGLYGSAAEADVIVVGAGVSGCACAATLAQAGIRVLIVSSCLDVVGMPGQGPAVAAPSVGWEEIENVFSELPAPLAVAWLEAASFPEDDRPLLIVDRRAVSIETKRLLEAMPGLQFRQGLIVDVRSRIPGGSSQRAAGDSEAGVAADSAHVEVETAFGEVLRAKAVVLAVGLGLGGLLQIGEQEMPGGRYGEVPADDLRVVLERAGVALRELEAHVGPRYGSRSDRVQGAIRAEEATRTGAGQGPPSRGEAPLNSCEDSVSACAGPRLLRLRDVLDGLFGGEGPIARDLTLSYRGHGEERPGPARMARLLLRSSTEGGDRLASRSALVGNWPVGAPPAPHKSERFRPSVAVMQTSEDCAETSGSLGPGGIRLRGQADPKGAEATPSYASLLLPDGVATLEFYEPAECAHDELADPGGTARSGIGRMVRPRQASSLEAGVPDAASRLGYVVRASVLAQPTEGRIRELGATWASGQIAGASNYLESLHSGVQTARRVMDHLHPQGTGANESLSGGAPASEPESSPYGPRMNGERDSET